MTYIPNYAQMKDHSKYKSSLAAWSTVHDLQELVRLTIENRTRTNRDRQKENKEQNGRLQTPNAVA